jgi:hypothetical protein
LVLFFKKELLALSFFAKGILHGNRSLEA